jgi:hypothetical protein
LPASNKLNVASNGAGKINVIKMKLTKRQKIIGIIGLVIVTLTIGTKTYLRQEKIRVALEFGHLAKLPDNSSNIQVDTKGGMFSRTFWLTYESTQDEIKTWLTKSKQLRKKGKPVDMDFKIITKDPETGELKEITKPKKSGLPKWFSPDDSLDTVDVFEVSIPEEALYGTVWIDWKENKVYIQTSYS